MNKNLALNAHDADRTQRVYQCLLRTKLDFSNNSVNAIIA